MKYANSDMVNGQEVILTVLPLDMVPFFDPNNPHPGTYLVEDEVMPGWIRSVGGWWIPPAVTRIVPRSVSRFQARAALFQAGLLDDVEAYMALPETDPIYRLAWQDAQDFFRNSATVNALKSVLGLNDSQLDDLFVFAGSITG